MSNIYIIIAWIFLNENLSFTARANRQQQSGGRHKTVYWGLCERDSRKQVVDWHENSTVCGQVGGWIQLGPNTRRGRYVQFRWINWTACSVDLDWMHRFNLVATLFDVWLFSLQRRQIMLENMLICGVRKSGSKMLIKKGKWINSRLNWMDFKGKYSQAERRYRSTAAALCI